MRIPVGASHVNALLVELGHAELDIYGILEGEPGGRITAHLERVIRQGHDSFTHRSERFPRVEGNHSETAGSLGGTQAVQ